MPQAEKNQQSEENTVKVTGTKSEVNFKYKTFCMSSYKCVCIKKYKECI